MMQQIETDFKANFHATATAVIEPTARSSTLDTSSFEAKRSREIVRERQDDRYASQCATAIREGQPVPCPNSWSEVSELAQRYPVVSITTGHLLAIADAGVPRLRATRGGRPLRLRRASKRVRDLWRALAGEILASVDPMHPDEMADVLAPVAAAIAGAAGWSESDLGWETHRAIGDAMRAERKAVAR